MQRIWAAVAMDLVPFVCTALGAGTVFFAPRPGRGAARGTMGLSAGVMAGAGVFGLLAPAAAQAPALAAAGFGLGAALLAALGAFGGRLAGSRSAGRLLLASALYNLPQGMAVGLTGAAAGDAASLAGALALSLGLGLQNLPEGAALSLPLHRAGMSRVRAFGTGAASGFVELAGAALAGVLAGALAPALPLLLGTAAGAMLCGSVRELAPAAVREGARGAACALLGFGGMVALSLLPG